MSEIPLATRRTSESRRHLNVATGGTEASYLPEEVQFMRAMDRYKTSRRRPFPTCCEVLGVLRSLGYRQVEAAAELPVFLPPVRGTARGAR